MKTRGPRNIFGYRILIAVVVVAITAGCSLEAKKSRLFKRAENYFNSGDYNKAKIEYLTLLRLDTRNATVFQRLGTIWFEQGAPLRAAPFFLKARELVPNNLSNRIQLIRVFLSVGDASAARKEAISILKESPENDEAMALLSETDRTKEDAAYTEQVLQRFHDHNKTSYNMAAANLAFHKGDTAAAEAALRRASQLDPKSPTPCLALAMLHLQAKDKTRALEELKKAADLPPARSTAKVRLAEFKALNGAVEEAKQMLQEVTRKTPDFFPAWLLQARIALSEKHYDEAISLLENVLSQDPENIDGRMLQAQVWLAQGEARKASEGLEQLSKSYPGVPGIKYQLALSYVQQNNLTQATDALKQAVAINPENVEAVLFLAQLNIRNNNLDEVVSAITDLLKKHPDLRTARLLLAHAFQLLKRLDDATAVLQEQLVKAPNDPQACLFLGLILREQNKNDEARKVFEKARELAPDNPAATEQLVQLDLVAKDVTSAMAKAQQALTKTPNSAASHFIEAQVYAATKTWDKAESALLKTLELDPKFSRAYDLLISVYVAQGKLPEAISRLEALLTKNPNNAAALMTSAMLYEQTKDLKKARGAYENLLTTNPDFSPALNNLAYLYVGEFKEVDKAYELANKAHQLQPDDASVADTLGWVLYKKRDYPRALSLLQQSAAKLSDNAEVQFHLGMANYMMGKVAPAKEALQRAMSSSTDFLDKEECKRRLALLQEGGEARDVSIDQMKKLLEQEPNDPVALQRIGELYEKQSSWAEAAASYEGAIKLSPSLLTPTIKLAQLNAGPLKNGSKAMTYAKRARELAPGDPKINGLLGNIAFQAGSFDWAYSLLQESMRRLPDDAEVRRGFAWAAYSLGKVTEARQAMQEVLKISRDPQQLQEANSFLLLTSFSQGANNAAAAPAEAEKVLHADPENVPALMVRADLARQRHQDPSAISIYNKILDRYPSFTPAQMNLASLYANDPATLAKASDLAIKAHKQVPGDIDFTRTLAEISYKKKDFDYALQLLKESATKKPLDALGLYYFGMSSLQEKQNAQARDALQRALSAGLPEPFSTEAKQALSRLH
jgi:tetratricopeptide (TPR) repeat protein